MNSETTVVLVTNNFPYYPGEYFLESEIQYWAKSNLNLIVMPNHYGNGNRRALNNNIIVSDYLLINKKKNVVKKAFTFLRIIISKIFWLEIKKNHTKITFGFINSHIKRVSEILTKKNLFEKYLSSLKNADKIVFYFYWYDLQSYAASIMNRKNNVKVISRAHGYDLYKERKANNYMPLKWQFVEKIDEVHAVSNQGKKYLQNTYYLDPVKVKISLLGVEGNNILSKQTSISVFHILSCASCIKLKRIDK
ncbi:MAG: hypothetical protein ACOCUI_01805, partial [bacterium]